MSTQVPVGAGSYRTLPVNSHLPATLFFGLQLIVVGKRRNLVTHQIYQINAHIYLYNSIFTTFLLHVSVRHTQSSERATRISAQIRFFFTRLLSMVTCVIEYEMHRIFYIDYKTTELIYYNNCCFVKNLPPPIPPVALGFLITHNDASQSVGLLWTSDQLVAETSS